MCKEFIDSNACEGKKEGVGEGGESLHTMVHV